MAEAVEQAIESARPSILVDGQAQPELARRLLRLVIAERADGLHRCEALFSAWGETQARTDFLYFDRRLLEFGKPLQFKLGTDPIFSGAIMALEGVFPSSAERAPPQLNVLAEDRLQALRMTRRTRSFEDISDSDLIQRIAGNHSLQVQGQVQGPTHKLLAQVNQSDLAFLRERARAIGADLWIEDGALHVESRAGRNAQAVELAYKGRLREFTVTADLAGQSTAVVASGWDVSAKEAIQFEADESAIRGELNGGDSGPAILADKFGDRKQTLAHTVPATRDEAEKTAQAFFRMAARRFVVGRGVAAPDARLKAGSVVDLQGLGPLFSGQYYLSEVRHRFDGSGLRTEFTAERAGIGKKA